MYAKATYGGKTASSSAAVKQAGNYVTSIEVSTNPSLSYSQFGAGDGTQSDGGSLGVIRYNYSSGSYNTTAPSSTYGSLSTSVSYSMTNGTGFYLTSSTAGTISAVTKGTTTTGVTSSNTITKTVSYT